MKTIGLLLLAAFAAHFTPMEAHYQQKFSSTEQADQKIYVSSDNLCIQGTEIFWQVEKDNWIPVSSINCDAQGIYLTNLGVSWSYYLCTSCRTIYREKPSECEVCGGTSFDLHYEDIWDRRS